MGKNRKLNWIGEKTELPSLNQTCLLRIKHELNWQLKLFRFDCNKSDDTFFM